MPDVICVTGKGYPDYATRKFLLLLQARTDAEFYYIGDADPFGADIFFNYYFGSARFGVQEHAVIVETLKLKWIGPFLQDFAGDALEATINTQKLSYKDVAKAYTVLSRPFFNAYPEF